MKKVKFKKLTIGKKSISNLTAQTLIGGITGTNCSISCDIFGDICISDDWCDGDDDC